MTTHDFFPDDELRKPRPMHLVSKYSVRPVVGGFKRSIHLAVILTEGMAVLELDWALGTSLGTNIAVTQYTMVKRLGVGIALIYSCIMIFMVSICFRVLRRIPTCNEQVGGSIPSASSIS